LADEEIVVEECNWFTHDKIHCFSFSRMMQQGMAISLIEEKTENVTESFAHELQVEQRLLTVQGTLRENWCASKSRTRSFVVVDTDEYARKVIEAFHQDFSREVNFESFYNH
jgi:hypothetical protein